MPLVTWDPSYSVKVSKCDEDHKKLFALLNALHEAMKEGKGHETIRQVLDELADYARFHFSQEEMLLKQTNYANCLPHQMQHRAFVKKVEEFQSDMKAGKRVRTIAVVDFLKDWLIHHIKQTDREYSDHLNAKGIS